MSKVKSKKKTADNRRTPKRLSHTLYSYVEPTNGKYAREFGKKYFGSFSAYLDILITADRKQHFSAKWIKSTKTEKTPAKKTWKKKTGKVVAFRRKKAASVKTETATQQAA